MNITHVYSFLAGAAFSLIWIIAFIGFKNPHDCADRSEPGTTQDQENKPW